MKGFLKVLAVLSVTLMLAVGCAVGLHSLKPGVDMATLLKVVDIMPADEQGWKILSIPDKDFAASGIEFVVFKKAQGDYGYGIVGNEGATIIIYDATKDAWFFCSFICQPIAEEDREQLEKEFLGFIDERGDFTKAGVFKIRAQETPGVEI